uniref:TonB-dependent receptor family protein n=1 Tax=Stappia sp. TaxID=1870903 RepID=UPI003BAB4734
MFTPPRPMDRQEGRLARRQSGRGLSRLSLLASTAILVLAGSEQGVAQSATPGAVVLDKIFLDVLRSDLEERLDAIAGGGAVVAADDYPDSGNLTIARALATVPGVVVQDFFGGHDQPRVQIRGSGLQQNPVERGVLMLQDGLPLNRADGSYIVGFANPRQADAIEVFRGYTSNRLGATSLGGALNFISPTGWADPGGKLVAGGGSFGQAGVAGQFGFGTDSYDGLFHFDASRRDGFRDYNESSRISAGANVGVEVSDMVTTRIFAGYTDLGFDVAGPLPKSYMKSDPRQVFSGPVVSAGGVSFPGPNVVRDRPRRDASQFLVGSRTTVELDEHTVDVALGYTYTKDSFRFPIPSGIRETEGGDFIGVLRYAFKPDAAATLPLFEATARYALGSASRDYFLNRAGTQGARFGQNELDASTLSVHAGFNVPLLSELTVSPAISFSHSVRDNRDVYDRATRPTIAYNPGNPTVALPDGAVPTESTSYSRSYSGWTPSLGLTYRVGETQTLFAAVSRSFEPPTHDDLLATVNGTPNSSPGRPNPGNPGLPASAFRTPDLDAQTASTVEAGWRGRSGKLSWDVVTYYSWVNNELLSLRDVTGASLGAVNAGDTRHFGVELGLGATLTDWLSGRIAYTFQDFRFRNDPVRGDNLLAGSPRHLLQVALQVQASEKWSLGASLKWVPDRTPVDNMNTLFADPYALVDLRSEYRISDTVSVFGEVTNLFDVTYASSTLIVDQARVDQAAFLPGDGRALYAGLKARF